MTAIKQIGNFSIQLQNAFLRMIMGRNVELTEAGKQEYAKRGVDIAKQDFFIKSIHEDETMTLVSQNQVEVAGIKLHHVNL